MNQILKKIIAILIIMLLMSTNMIILVNESIATDGKYNSQNSKTNNSNVEFNAYFEGKVHEINSDISSENLKLYIELSVKNAGYLKNITVNFNEANFTINPSNDNEYIQNIDKENNKIDLKQINKGEKVVIEIPISFLHKDDITIDYLSKEFKTVFKSDYIDNNGKSNSVEKTVLNCLSFNGEAEIENTMKINKFIPYVKGEKYGVLLQMIVNNKIKDNKFPIKTSKTTIAVPELNGIKPANISVIANNTIATNGKEDGIDFNSNNYTYDQESNNFIIDVENMADENNMIKWKKDSTDEFLVTFLYEGEDLYNKVVSIQNNSNVQNELFDIVTNIKVENELYVNGSHYIYKEFNYTNELKEKIGELTTAQISSIKEISKGYIYANYNIEKDKEKNETLYNITYSTNVENVNLVDSIEFMQQIDKFKTEEGTIGLTTLGNKNITYNKEVKISKSIFDKILGENGKIEIFDNTNTKLGEINKDTKINNSNEYTIDISSFNTNQLIIKTTKPILEGNIKINVTKAIAKNIDYSAEEMKEFKTIQTSVIAKTLENSTESIATIEMKEPKSEAKIEINKEQLSTVTKNNNVELRATLDTSSVYNALYENPTISIELPKEVEKIEVTSIKALYNDELEIKDAKLTEKNGNKYIDIKMEGTQTKYSTENSDIKGTSIVINANIELDKLGTNNESEIKMVYKNNSEEVNEEKTVKTDIPIIAPTGLITTNEVSNYKEGAEDILVVSDETKEITVDTYSETRDAEFKGQIINNYENNISNISILGRFPTTGNKNVETNEDLASNMTLALKSKMTISGDNVDNIKVYYSSNVDATNNISDSNNGWTLEPTNLAEVKSYLIVAENTVFENGQQINFSYIVNLPANLTHNNSTSTMYKVFYDNNSEIGTMKETKISPIIKLTTGQGPELEVKLTSSLPEGIEIQNYQYVRYYITVKNVGDINAENVKVNIPIPENAVYVEFEEVNNVYTKNYDIKQHTISIGDLNIDKEIELSYELLVNSREQKEDNNITSYIEVTADNINGKIKSNEYKLMIKKLTTDTDSYIPLSIINGTNTSEYNVYTEGNKIIYTIKIQSNTSEVVNNVVANVTLPNDVKNINSYIKAESGNITEGVNITDKSVNVNVGNIGNGEEKIVIVEFTIGANTQEKFSTMVQVTADNIGTHYSNERWITVGKIGMTGKQLEPEKEYVKEGEEFKYSFEIDTTGTADIYDFVLEDELPEELKLVRYSFKLKTIGEEDSDKSVSGAAIQKDGKVYVNISRIPKKSKLTIELTVSGKLSNNEDKELINKAYIYSDGFEKVELNSTNITLEYDSKLHDNNEGEQSKQTFKITGVAWLDENTNGERDEEEQTIPGIEVMLVYKSNGQVVKDQSTGANKVVTTRENGQYEFNNLSNGEYLVVFLYDSGLYSITTYQKNEVDTNKNSDAIETNINYNGENKIGGVTDTIQIIDNNVRNIDIGLYKDEKFDLSLEKYVTKIALTTPTIGTAKYEYGDSTLEKVEILAQNTGKSSMVIEYKIVIKNEGGIAGYAKKIVDYLPKGVGFSTDLNKDWYLSETNGNIYNTSLENIKLEPGETKELKLILTKQITEDSIGETIKNQAEIYESYNEQGLKDIDSTEANKVENEDDIGEADVLISLVTGKIIMYTGLIILILTIITISIIIIKKKVLQIK